MEEMTCPFCGKMPQVESYETIFFITVYRVSCKNIHCKIRPYTDWYRTEQRAIGEWNTRENKSDKDREEENGKN